MQTSRGLGDVCSGRGQAFLQMLASLVLLGKGASRPSDTPVLIALCFSDVGTSDTTAPEISLENGLFYWCLIKSLLSLESGHFLCRVNSVLPAGQPFSGRA